MDLVHILSSFMHWLDTPTLSLRLPVMIARSLTLLVLGRITFILTRKEIPNSLRLYAIPYLFAFIVLLKFNVEPLLEDRLPPATPMSLLINLALTSSFFVNKIFIRYVLERIGVQHITRVLRLSRVRQ